MSLAETVLRLLAASAAGAIIGVNRDWERTPIGVRTLALVALGAASITVAAIQAPGLAGQPDAYSRVVQGVVQGIMGGISFIGAGVILRDARQRSVHGLTTAAAVWVTAALGVACGLGGWRTVLVGTAMAVLLLAGLTPLRRRVRGEAEEEKKG